MESTRVTLGFRALEFQLSEPLTEKIWRLEDFEGHPALLSSTSIPQRCRRLGARTVLRQIEANLSDVEDDTGLGGE
ncbi:hypothetical protein K1719_004871 [Acacia pycnantha]|nr:hypothetical protein K1719_004871 [Acacia pycnantha]